MQENTMLGKWMVSAKLVSVERLMLLSDLVSVLASSPRKGEWYAILSKFESKEPCKISVTREDHTIYRAENEDDKLGRLVDTIGKLPGGVLRVLCRLTNKLSSFEEGSVWCRELSCLLEGRACWIARSQGVAYLRYLFHLRGSRFSLAVYELIRRGNFQEIFGTVRDGRLDKICLPSLRLVNEQCKHFYTPLSSIKGNEAVFLPYTDEEGKTFEKRVACVDVSWPGEFRIIKDPLNSSAIWEPMDGRTPSRRRVFVIVDHP